ncbi:glutathione S-transferase family protein [Zavarzinia sp. CC-PAN008]|uniref:glutathione S-transferase family protein n=1 Tax=Zavarzinia sp. CC-PAN008 TaxID=3243332 RepID=UPI003F74A801
MPILYEHPLSPYAQKVKIALDEKGVAYETRQPDVLAGGDAAFLAAALRAEVPAYVDEDVHLFDSTLILDYIDDRWPEPGLLAATPAERARVRAIEEVCDTTLEAINWGLSEVRYWGRATGDTAAALEESARVQYAGILRWLQDQLGERPWFNGAEFGRGDLAVAPFLMGVIGFGHGPVEGSALHAWVRRVRQRPSVARVFAAAKAALPALAASGAQRPREGFRREYRDHRLDWMIRSGGLDVVLDGIAKQNIRFTREVG